MKQYLMDFREAMRLPEETKPRTLVLMVASQIRYATPDGPARNRKNILRQAILALKGGVK